MMTPALALALLLTPAPSSAIQAPTLAAAPVQAPGQAVEPGQEVENVEQDRKRILHLTDGSVLRARTRRDGDVWEYRQRGEWKPLPASRVARVVDERRILQQARDLEREIEGGDAVRRVALADWMVAQGLVEEAIGQLDRVLRAEPGQPDAVQLLSSPPRALQIFRSRDDPSALLREVAGATPALRELALARLAELEEAAVLHQRYRETLLSHSYRLRTLAAQGLGRQFPGEEVRGLLGRSVLDGSEDVRREAALALGEANEPALILPLLRAIGSQHEAVRKNAIQALGNAGYPAAVEPLMSRLSAIVSSPQSSGSFSPPRSNIFVGRQIAYIQDFDVEVAQFAAVADPQVNVLTEGSVLDVRVIGVSVHSVAIESRAIRTSLAQLTGENPGNYARSWLQWWEQNRGDWVNEPPTRTAPGE